MAANNQNQNPNPSNRPQPPQPPPPPPSSSASSHRRYPNPPEASIPDPATLREQWSYAKKQYSRWYSSAWGTAILAGLSFYALGWIIKGSNPLPSLSSSKNSNSNNDDRKRDTDEGYIARADETRKS